MSIVAKDGSTTGRSGGDLVLRSGQHPTPVTPRISNIALKVVMAVTGTIFVAFVLVHMIGNLKVFFGPEDYNAYAVFLRNLLYPLLPHGGALLIFRIVLGTALLLHVVSGVSIWYRGRRARGRFRRTGLRGLTFGARTMIISGLIVLAFVVVHLLDLTIGAVVASSSFQHPTHVNGELTATAYENLVASLSRPWMAIFYTLVMAVVSVHIAQGCWNVVNDLGITGPRLRKILLLVGLLVALAIVVCNGALPMLILAGVIA